ncbi:hypothetical protein BJF92_07705 [Rhizobium rhizosphaerae]|uniref:DNA/RNA non-specific endonuclease n=1 Tax=Xaviernesmea rhizosphaerae TaxID=1672749 RepID=A0A1Q9AJS9_9HYPH|nr:hypothetical protein BJF92_07705 [Xaviernesmea rhizosphaerae]
MLLTNWHVFPEAANARGAGANFLYEQGDSGLARGITFELDPDALFHADQKLDFAIVAVKPTAVTGELLSSLQFLSINGSGAKILPGMPIMMIEYPNGGAKRYATTNNRLLEIRDDGFLRYETDTDGGSSGAPGFSDAWEVCALHHASIPKLRGNDILNKDGSVWNPGDPEDSIYWIANEGVRISFVVKALGAIKSANPTGQRLLEELLAGTIDPADEVAKLTAQGVPEAAPQGASTTLLPTTQSFTRNTMAVTMNFSGPVTIFVGGATPTAMDIVSPAPSVLEPEKALRFDPNYDDRKGYDPNFLGNGIAVPLPSVAPAHDREMYKEDGAIRVLDYYHYSLAMNAVRRMQMWSAVNVDYDKAKRMVSGRKFFGDDRWIGDPRIPAKVQLADHDVYAPAGQIDRGHIVRREDNAWGETPTEVEFGNSDTFHWTNCTPQHAAFNRSNPGKQWDNGAGLWGGFENHIQQNLQTGGDTRACILAGPVLADDDPSEDFGTGPVRYPLTFWKVVAVASQDAGGGRTLRTYGFLLSQADVVARFGVEFAAGEYARYQVPLATIAEKTGVIFDDVLLRADTKAA